MTQLALLRMTDAMDYLRRSYQAHVDGDIPAAKEYLARSTAMERRAKRHWKVAHRGVKR